MINRLREFLQPVRSWPWPRFANNERDFFVYHVDFRTVRRPFPIHLPSSSCWNVEWSNTTRLEDRGAPAKFSRHLQKIVDYSLFICYLCIHGLCPPREWSCPPLSRLWLTTTTTRWCLPVPGSISKWYFQSYSAGNRASSILYNQ